MSREAEFIIQMMRKNKSAHKPGEKKDYVKHRAFMNSALEKSPLAEGVTFETLKLNGVEAVCCTPAEVSGDSVVLYVHGGGFSGGNAVTSKGYASFLAQMSGLRVYTLSYRVAPENAFPCAHEDCFSAYKALLDLYPEKKIGLVGGSAGGNLCLGIALQAREAGIRMPSALALFSPVGDMSGVLPSRRLNDEKDCSMSAGLDAEHQEVYLQGADARNPLVSPIYADLKDFPGILLIADGSEVLLDDSALLYAHAKSEGVDAELVITNGLFHDFPSAGPVLPEGKKAMEETVNWLRRCGM